MIFTERQITVHKGKSSINEPVILYRGDYEVSIKFTIMESKFRFKSGVNLVDSEKASHGQLAILAPYGGNVFSEIVKCEDGTVTFTLTKEMIDQLEEVGLYSFQIRLFDYYRESRVSIPPVEFGIEVREPVASEDHDNEINNAIVGYSIAKVVDGLNEDVGDTFDDKGQYNKTDWKTGDRISQGKLNKIEDALDKINQNEITNKNALNKQMTSNFNVLTSQLEDIANKGTTVEVIEQATKEEIERQILDGTIANLTIEDYSITEEKLNFPIIKGIESKNLFNKATAKLGGYYDTGNGLWIEDNSSGLCGSEFIRIEPNSIYTLAFPSYKCFYDSTKNKINDTENNKYDNKVITPSNVKYCRISFKETYIDSQQMIKGDSVGDFIPYGNTIDLDYFPKNSIGNDLIANGAIKNNNIENGTITKEKFKNGAISLEDVDFSTPSKNLFNKNTATLNKYIDIGNGITIVDSSDLSYSDFIEVESDTEYSLNYACYVIYYDENKKIITSTSMINNFTTPLNCHYIILDLKTSNLDKQQLEKGNVSTTFVEYGYKINEDFIPKSSSYENMLIVSKDGKGNCNTIQKAVEQAGDGDVIIVMPGEYEEYVICGSKNVSIIGVDRQKCVLYNTTGDYNKCPLYINKGHVKNLTIKSLYDENIDYSSLSAYAYAVHIDNYGKNGELIIEDCDILCDFNNTLGCGATSNHRLIIRNCNIESTNKSGLTLASSFAYHGGAKGCEADIIFDNNRWKSNYRDIVFQTDGTPNILRISAFYNNCSIVVMPYKDEIYFVNDDSFGNKNELLNG